MCLLKKLLCCYQIFPKLVGWFVFIAIKCCLFSYTTRSIWKMPGVTAFFDARLTLVNTRSNKGKSTTTIFREHESEKKRKDKQRMTDVVMVTFTPRVFGTNGNMGVDCHNFLRTLSDEISNKNNEPCANVISYLRIELSFAILRSVHKCVKVQKPLLRREIFRMILLFYSHVAGVS